MLAYLSRYTHRVAISNRRLLALDERGVTFRWKDYRATGKTRYKAMTLAADEFMRRFLLHVLPSGFHRIRHYGLLANAGRREHLARARELLHVRSRGGRTVVVSRSAGRHRAAHLRLPALWCRDAHRRDLRPRRTDPRAAHVASCSMITATLGPNCPSALRRPPPIADGFALRCRSVALHPRIHPRFRQRRTDTRSHAMSPVGRAVRSRHPAAPQTVKSP